MSDVSVTPSRMTRTDVPGPEPLRTDAECEALDAGSYYAATHGLSSPPEAAYLDALPAARRDILARFVRGVLRGDPAGLPGALVRSVSDGALVRPGDPPPLARFDGDELLARAAVPEECEQLAILPLPASGAVLVVPLGAIHAYDRFHVASPVTVCTPEAANRLTHPVDLAWLLAWEGAFPDAAQAERIRAEVAESVANLALARLAARVQANDRARDPATGDPSVSVLDAPAGALPSPDRATALERRVTDGHPFHPGAKIRRGMTPAAGLAYAPEFAGTVDLRFVAVRTDYALRTRAGERESSLTRRLYDAFDGLESAVAGALPAGALDEYATIPVHPWQYHHVVPTRYADQRDDGRVVSVPYAHSATPLLNFRTVVPHATVGVGGDDEHLPHCKLAVGVQLTNVERTLSPQAVHNGPRVTALLRDVVARESLTRIGVLAEPAAACYHPPDGPHPDGDAFDDARHLSGLVRQNPYTHPFVTDDARLVPAASLPVDAGSGTDHPVARELVERYADGTDTTDIEAATLAFLGAYADVVVPEHLLLLCKYGVALEAHLQNALVAVEDGRPVAVLVRDFGGIRAHAGRLADHGFALDAYPDSDLDADGREDLYRKLYYALFQNHLAELVVALVRTTPVDESACWARVAERCHDAFDDLRADPAVPDERVARDEAALFAEPAVHKALTAMRLRGKRHEYVTSRVSNPLAPFARRDG